ncbi:MAG: alpha/beta hydrolase [Dehalococcoidia bacterium]|tara:strand:+ start:171 stop:827 length:657 start_codon:yes stop_codon:yes gene_type:complete
MKAEAKQDLSLPYIYIEPDGFDENRSYPMMLVLHGFGANMQDLAGLTPMISSTDYIYICPNAPMEFDLGIGAKGYGWHPPRDLCSDDDIQTAIETVNGFIDEVIKSYNIEKSGNKLLGFSQGGGMTYRCGLSKPEVFDQLIGLSSSMPNPDSLLSIMPDSRTQKIFIAHGTKDGVVPISNGEETQAFLKSQGYEVLYNEYDMAHEIREAVISDIVNWL